jgi:hypothetical protein
MFKLPDQQHNPVQITVRSSQIDKDTDTLDKRVFGKKSFAIVYGSRFTGKSVLLSNLVEQFYLGKNGFKSILILTPSLADKAWNNIRGHRKVTVFNKCTNSLLEDLFKDQEKLVAKNKKKNVSILLIVDDFATQGKCLKALEELAIRGRHAQITVVVTAQYSRLLSPVIRQNATDVVLFKLSDFELKNLAEEGLRSMVPVEEFVEWVKEHTQKPRDFVYINLRDAERVFNIGFSDKK